MTKRSSKMTVQEKFEQGLLDDSYADFIMDHGKGDRVICSGDTLLDAMEDGYLIEEFLKSIEIQQVS
jgi:hypothetical protein